MRVSQSPHVTEAAAGKPLTATLFVFIVLVPIQSSLKRKGLTKRATSERTRGMSRTCDWSDQYELQACATPSRPREDLFKQNSGSLTLFSHSSFVHLLSSGESLSSSHCIKRTSHRRMAKLVLRRLARAQIARHRGSSQDRTTPDQSSEAQVVVKARLQSGFRGGYCAARTSGHAVD